MKDDFRNLFCEVGPGAHLLDSFVRDESAESMRDNSVNEA